MIQGNNVVKLKNTYIKDQIDMWLRRKGRSSEETKKAYERDIKKFFEVVKGKDYLEYLTEEDLQITYDDFEHFIDTLHELTNEDGKRKFNNKTINRNVSAVKELLRYLLTKKLVADISYFESIESLPEVKNEYGVLSVPEVYELADLARQERNLREVKYYFILFALDTCLRKSAILNLKWSDFEEHEDHVIVRAVDKGNKDFRKSISKEFFEDLKSIKKDNDDRVFPISKKSIDEMFPRLVKQIPSLKNRNIAFHSVRKSGITFQYRISGSDILQAQKAAGHSNISTTQRYLESLDYGSIGAVSSSKDLDLEMFKKVSHEELIKCIEDLPKDLKLILNIKLNQQMKK